MLDLQIGHLIVEQQEFLLVKHSDMFALNTTKLGTTRPSRYLKTITRLASESQAEEGKMVSMPI